MADIFISYSSKDREKADQLRELLASAGLSVWIDQSGIDAATSWSKEIVIAISNCNAFILLLSAHSVASHNVIKEVSLASEKQKKIVPIDIEAVIIPAELEYQLAGIQRTPIANADAIIRALGKTGGEIGSIRPFKLKDADSRKSLMILPFEDLSPAADNGWFADGIVSELINALGTIRTLRVMDAQTTRDFKNYKGNLSTYANEMNIRYFVQGDVRKFGEQIKISSRLLDIETSDRLWQDSLKGTMDDIFDIQETVAKNVVDGLQIILTKEEERTLDQKQTQSVAAQECFFKAEEHYNRATKKDYEQALVLYNEAVELDPTYLRAHQQVAITAASLYRFYGRNPDYYERAERAAERIFAIHGESADYARIKSLLARIQGSYETAVNWALRAIELDPEYALAYDALGHANQHLGRTKETVEAWTKLVELRNYDLTAQANLLVAIRELGDMQTLRDAAHRALPAFESYVRLNPDDLNTRVDYINVLGNAGRSAEALIEAGTLAADELLDGKCCYNLGCYYMHENIPDRAMKLFKYAVERGFRHLVTFKRDPDLDPLRGTPEFEALIKELQETNG
jgi:adenylate cyclase